MSTELQLLQERRKIHDLYKYHDEKAKKAKIELGIIESQIIDQLTDKNATSTAKYEGVGFASIAKPRLFATYSKDQEGKFFEFLKETGNDSLIKPTVHSSSLTSFIGQLLEEGKTIPNYISYYLKPNIRFYTK